MSILVMGVGNTVMSDDGFGPAVVALLEERYQFEGDLRMVDGGTLGLDLLPMLEGIDRLMIVDALTMGKAPGTIVRLEGDEVPRAFASKLSIHQMGMQDLLSLAELMGHLPTELLVWGVEPQSIEMTMELTAPVEQSIPQVIEGIIQDLELWNVRVRKNI